MSPQNTTNLFFCPFLYLNIVNSEVGASELAQQIRALTSLPSDMSSVPGTHMAEEEIWLLKIFL